MRNPRRRAAFVTSATLARERGASVVLLPTSVREGIDLGRDGGCRYQEADAQLALSRLRAEEPRLIADRSSAEAEAGRAARRQGLGSGGNQGFAQTHLIPLVLPAMSADQSPSSSRHTTQ
jgi:hypothetical protein